ncbi:hypothetical protein CK203_002553 [Vitis vinifera]|uniref:PGG domain-containing protein n=1 Tax=Vitis vinifera TaxID=29760 RepID=A0A438KHK3_VITVI|nr:hypothetical protein CK203_002553 [Vitis vinifera]
MPTSKESPAPWKKNIVLLPMENRHSHVYQLLLNINILKDILYLVEWMIKGKVHCILLQCLLIIVFALSLCCIWEIKWKIWYKRVGQCLASKANSCPVVATLIATVAFTTSAAVPGGTKKTALHIFTIS